MAEEKEREPDDKQINALVEKYYAHKVAEVKIEWPLVDGNCIIFQCARRVTEQEYNVFRRLLTLAKPSLVQQETAAATGKASP